MSSFDLSLLIPAYNESQRISPALDRIIEYLGAQTYSWEMLIVDDGSRDETASLVAKRIEGITNAKLIAYQPNRAKDMRGGNVGGAGSGSFLDADLSTPPEEIIMPRYLNDGMKW